MVVHYAKYGRDVKILAGKENLSELIVLDVPKHTLPANDLLCFTH